MAHYLFGKRAREWIDKMQRRFADQIQDSIARSKIYDGRFEVEGSNQPEIVLVPIDSTTAIFEFAAEGSRTAVLNFANFFHQGGGFLSGSSAQEEMLCQESDLYNVISNFDGFYSYNQTNFDAFAGDRAIYSPDVIFVDENRTKSCDVITCASVHLHRGMDLKKNSKVMKSRIEFIREIAEDQKVEILILGALGCGAFHQNPEEISKYFREAFQNRCSSVKKIIYAILPGDNFDEFCETFSDAKVDDRKFETRYFLKLRQKIFKGEFDDVHKNFSILKAERARKHHSRVSKKFADEIQNSIDKSKIYDGRFEVEGSNQPEKISVEPIGSVEAIFKFDGDRMAVLNFASFKHPGGFFLQGSPAQEESLCHSSILFEVLKNFPNFYKENMNQLNDELFVDRAIYSPDVIFCRRDRQKSCGVITCAAPNLSKTHRSPEENSEALRSRIEFIREIAEDQNIDTLILGAFGCGIFGQDPFEVSKIFRETFANRCSSVQKIIYAIPPSKNLEAFQKIFQ